MKNVQEKIGHTFKNINLLETALTHSSYANESKKASNERLEFLGDSVLSLVISDYIFRRLPNVAEGWLSKYRATLVCEQSLYEISKKISLSKFILLGKGEEMTGGRERPSIVSDAFEAVLAAIYLDGGMEKARAWVINLMRDSIDDVIMGHGYADYKTMLQEALQKGNKGKVTYRTISETGQDHNKTFEVEVLVDEVPQNRGKGHNKKEAEQNAAHTALKNIGK
ncbi:MAG: ribonuclease III [Oscillospiraceae bacterium]|nr:ribonuclease III [Oscillospiraceae bacterium]